MIKNCLRYIVIFAFVLMLFPYPIALAKEPARLALVFDGRWEQIDEILELVKGEILALTEDEFDIHIGEEDVYIADWTPESNQQLLDQVYSDDNIDIVLTIGVVSTNAAIQQKDIPKPTVATLVLDRELQNAPLTEDHTSGVKNLSYTAFSNTFGESIRKFYEVIPFSKVAWIVNRHVITAIPALQEQAQEFLKEQGVEVEFISIEDSIDEALEEISLDVDAVIVAPQSYLSSEQMRYLADGLIERRLPSLALTGKNDLRIGLLVSVTQEEIDYVRLSRRIALNVQSILLGDPASELPVFIEESDQLSINMATARAIGFSPSWDVMSQADLMYREQIDMQEISIVDAIRVALRENLSIAAQIKSVDSTEQNIRQAWARVLPQVNLSNTYSRIDEDRAVAALGSAPEKSASANVTASQVLYSNDLFRNITIEKEQQQSRREALVELRLDIALNTAIAYLEVLKRKNQERIQRENLRVSKANLRLAQSREDVGYSGPADVYRWESEIATNQQNVIRTRENYNGALVQLNRFLHRPLEDQYRLQEPRPDSEFFVMEKSRIVGYTRNAELYRLFRDFFVEEALRHAPEVRQLAAQIAAQENVVKKSKAEFWQPDVSASISLTDNYYEGGSGVASAQTTNDRDTTFSVKAAFPLFEGGDKVATVRQAQASLQQLTLQKAATEELVEQDMRTRLHDVGASSEAIDLSQEAAEAARKSLELMTESYSQGTVGITDLLDAQNARLNADLNAENAAFDFMIDIMEVQRSLGYYFFMLDEVERDEWYERFEQFFADAGAEPVPN